MKNHTHASMNHMQHDPTLSMMGEALFPYPHTTLLQEPERIPGRKTKQESVPKRRQQYTRLACFSCRDKHQKCDGGQPACFNCLSKGLECVYREERNRRRDEGGTEEAQNLRTELQFWQEKYLELKRFVDETLYHISLSQQLMPFMTSQPSLQATTTTTTSPPETKPAPSLTDPMLGGMLNSASLPSIPFDFYPQPLSGEAQALFSNSLFSNPNIGHTLMGTQLNTDPTDIALKNMQNQMFAHQTYQLPTPQ